MQHYGHLLSKVDLQNIALWLTQRSPISIKRAKFICTSRYLFECSSFHLLIELHPEMAAFIPVDVSIQTSAIEHLQEQPTSGKPSNLFANLKAQIEGSMLGQVRVLQKGGFELILAKGEQAWSLYLWLHIAKPYLEWCCNGQSYYLPYTPAHKITDITKVQPTPSSPMFLHRLFERFTEREHLVNYEDVQRKIRAHFEPKLRELTSKQQRLYQALQKLPSPDNFMHEGLLVQSFRHLYDKENPALVVFDWQSQQYRTIIIEGTIQDHVQKLFGKAKGIRAKRSSLERALEAIKESLTALKLKIEDHLKAGKIPLSTNPATPTALKARSPYRAYTFSGATILVGKTSQDNMTLSFHIAKGNDIWLHVDNYAGSHVIVKTKNAQLPQDILQAAGLLAHHFSQARKKKQVQICVSQAKWIRKIAGAKPGTVSVTRSKLIDSTYDEKLLSSLLMTLQS